MEINQPGPRCGICAESFGIVEVARHAGHGVAVLLKIYARCIDGQATAANQRITEALGIRDAEADPGDESDNDTEQAS